MTDKTSMELHTMIRRLVVEPRQNGREREREESWKKMQVDGKREKTRGKCFLSIYLTVGRARWHTAYVYLHIRIHKGRYANLYSPREH
jgi:hypothetical protein